MRGGLGEWSGGLDRALFGGFRFVLDYKIKELKKQIEPREVEIMEMKEQIKDMDQAAKH